MAALAQAWDPLEVGGVLAGYWKEDAVVITDVVGPGEHAQHRRHTFLPDHAFHAEEIARLYTASQGTHVYLGDWHTHPRGAPRLSPMDKRTLRAIAISPEARCPRPIMALLSGCGQIWQSQVFTLGQDRGLLSPAVELAELRLF